MSNAYLVSSQCNDPIPAPGLYCSTEHPTNPAPIICALECLDGFEGTLPSELLMPQPDPLCNGGIANNVSWFAFVAGSNFIDLSIIPVDCDIPVDDDGNPTTTGIQAGIYEDCSWDNSIVCETDGCHDLVAETLNLSSGDFIIGQVYYLFVDGCGGSVCDYEVQVNTASQPFEMEEITQITNNLNIDLSTDTICQGAELTLFTDTFPSNIMFDWSISPATVDYPSGNHPLTDTSGVTFTFNESGSFTIYVYAFNDCDATDTDSVVVHVKSLEDEIFTDIGICQECFPITLITPGSGCLNTQSGGNPTILTEDPNGDGVPGWQGTSMVTGPGLDTNWVTNMFGCEYMQIVNIVEIPISPRVQVDYYYCLQDFPVMINGINFNAPGDTRNITLDGAAVSGCDSLLAITAHAIDLFGSLEIGDCENGQVELAFDISMISPTDYDNVSYKWVDQNNNEVTDSDGIDSIIIVTGIGSYSVEIEVDKDGTTCMLSFGPYMINVDNLSPATPTVTYSPIQVCASESLALIYVADQNLGETNSWDLIPPVPYTFGLTTDTIYVDISSAGDFQFCVTASNGCGISQETCDNVIVNQVPSSEFTLPLEICVDSVVTATYIGPNGMGSNTYHWDFGSGTITNGADITSSGPFELAFPTSGSYDVSLVVDNNGCNSITNTQTISIVDPFSPPVINCISSVGQITFYWDPSSITNIEYLIVTGQSDAMMSGDSLIISNLASEESVMVELIFNDDDACGGTMIVADCMSLPCPNIDFTIALGNQYQCIDDEKRDLELAVEINGDTTGIGIWESPFVYMDYIFDVQEAGHGSHPVTFRYMLNDCEYSIDTVIHLYESPDLDYEMTLDICDEENPNKLNIDAPSNSIVMLNNEVIILRDKIPLTENTTYTIEAINSQNCSSDTTFTTGESQLGVVSILGESEVLQGTNSNYDLDTNIDLDSVQIIWVFNQDTLCTDCITVPLEHSEEGTLCVYMIHNQNCVFEDCIEIEITIQTEIYMPNIFSPNNDGVNDLFILNSNDPSTMILSAHIYDRWGNKVFEESAFNVSENIRAWDGTVNGKSCEPGVYVYVISYSDHDNNIKQISGDITLVK